jgi:hypothetical protein
MVGSAPCSSRNRRAASRTWSPFVARLGGGVRTASGATSAGGGPNMPLRMPRMWLSDTCTPCSRSHVATFAASSSPTAANAWCTASFLLTSASGDRASGSRSASSARSCCRALWQRLAIASVLIPAVLAAPSLDSPSR